MRPESLTGRRVLNFPRSALNWLTYTIMRTVIKAHSRCSWKWYSNIRARYGIVLISAECTGDCARIEGDSCVYNRDEPPSSFYYFAVQTSNVNSKYSVSKTKFYIHSPSSLPSVIFSEGSIYQIAVFHLQCLPHHYQFRFDLSCNQTSKKRI